MKRSSLTGHTDARGVFKRGERHFALFLFLTCRMVLRVEGSGR